MPVVRGTVDDGPLSQAQLDAFDRDGMLQVPDLFSTDEVHALLDELARLKQDPRVREADGTIKAVFTF